MSTTINVVCYKSKVLKNSESPLMLRICKDGKRKYESIGISLDPRHWDFKNNRPTSKCPNKEYIQKVITEKTRAYTDKILELKAMEREFTANVLAEKVNSPIKTKTVGDVFLDYIQRLTAEKRTGYMLSVKQVYNSLLKFNKHLNIYFPDIDIAWLRKYESWLRSNNIKENTIGIRFRTLRAIYNLAIEENIVKVEYYPFKKYKVSKLHEETAKRAITKDEINSILNYKSSNPYTRFPIDLFAFTYFTGGINFVDIAYLTKDNIIDNRLVYYRRKTGKLIKFPLQPKAIELIQKYSSPDNPYLFPILSSFHKTEQQQRNRVHKVISKVNDRLNTIGKELNLPIDLTTYVARHSFATSLKRSGVQTSMISEALGHSSERVTQIYLDSFGNDQMDDAMKNLL